MSSSELPVWIKIYINKLVVAGQSFGGITAIRAAILSPLKVKACLTFDPWLYVYEKEALDGRL